MRRLSLLALLLAACATAPPAPEPQSNTPEDPTPVRFLRELDAGQVHFGQTDGMRGVLHQELDGLGREMKKERGALRWARVASHSGGAWDVDAVYARSPFPERFTLVFDGQERLSGLWFRGPASGAMTAKELRDALAGLPGQTSAFVQAAEHREVQLGYRADEPQSVASQYKVLLLARTCADVGRKVRSLDDRIELPADVRGIPSCTLCQFDAGLQPTLRDLLHLLVATSDNTAADLLRQVLGVEEVTRFAELNGVDHPPPLISTQGLFALECGLGPLRAMPASDRAARLAAMSPEERVQAADDAARDGFRDGAEHFGQHCGEVKNPPEAARAIAHVVDWPMRADELVALYTNAQLDQLEDLATSECFVEFMGHGGAGPIPHAGGYLWAGTKNGLEQDVRSVGVLVETDRGPIAVSVSSQQFPGEHADKMLEHDYDAAHALVNWAYAQLPPR